MGSNGQLGNCLLRRFALDADLIWVGYAREDLDVCDAQKILEVLSAERPDFVVNAAAYTDVDQAESDQKMAWEVNAVAPGVIARICCELDIALVHLSTDYVFNGHSSDPYHELRETDPLGVYGHSKLQGENFLSKSSCKNVTVRTSWLFSPYGKNFVKTIARLGKEKKNLKVVNNQWGRPTYGMDLAKTILKLIFNNSIFTFWAFAS